MSRARMVLAAAAVGAFAAAILAAPAKADGRGGVIASGLDSPRGLTVARDVLEIAKNGLTSGDATGALTRVGRDGSQQEVPTGVCPGGAEVLKVRI